VRSERDLAAGKPPGKKRESCSGAVPASVTSSHGSHLPQPIASRPARSAVAQSSCLCHPHGQTERESGGAGERERFPNARTRSRTRLHFNLNAFDSDWPKAPTWPKSLASLRLRVRTDAEEARIGKREAGMKAERGNARARDAESPPLASRPSPLARASRPPNFPHPQPVPPCGVPPTDPFPFLFLLPLTPPHAPTSSTCALPSPSPSLPRSRRDTTLNSPTLNAQPFTPQGQPMSLPLP
jgi:hypothetical protein